MTGISGTNIDLSALDVDTALELGHFIGEQILAAEKRGYDQAIDRLRDDDAFWGFMENHPDGEDGAAVMGNPNGVAADYLNSSWAMTP